MLRTKYNKNRDIDWNIYGIKGWFLNCELHRENGPALEWSEGDKEWYLNDKYYTESAYKAELIKRGIKNA